jgi:hypothetical protein
MEAITGTGAERECCPYPRRQCNARTLDTVGMGRIQWWERDWTVGLLSVSVPAIDNVIVTVRQPAHFSDEHGTARYYESACTGMVNQWQFSRVILSCTSQTTSECCTAYIKGCECHVQKKTMLEKLRWPSSDGHEASRTAIA